MDDAINLTWLVRRQASLVLRISIPPFLLRTITVLGPYSHSKMYEFPIKNLLIHCENNMTPQLRNHCLHIHRWSCYLNRNKNCVIKQVKTTKHNTHTHKQEPNVGSVKQMQFPCYPQHIYQVIHSAVISANTVSRKLLLQHHMLNNETCECRWFAGDVMMCGVV